MKWYNFETSFMSLRDALSRFLKEHGIRYELSDASGKGYRCYHFEVLLDKDGVGIVNDFLDSQTIAAS